VTDLSSRGPQGRKDADTSVSRTSFQLAADLTEAWVLRALDQASRALAQRLWSEDGVPLGLDSLEIQPLPADLRGTVMVTVRASLLEDMVTRHAVDYRVTLRRPMDGPGRGPEVRLAAAAGWTWVPSNGPLNALSDPSPPAGTRGRQ
jgi:hypothetical protein